MMGEASWRQRLVWGACGFLLAIVAVLARDPGLLWRQQGNPKPDAVRRAAHEPTGTAPDDAAGGVGECYLGVVMARESVGVAPEIEGELESVLVRVGDTVERDQKLATLDTQTLSHQLAIEHASLRAAQADRRNFELQVQRVDQEHQRRQTLDDVLSREELESAGFDVEVAAARLESAAAEVARVEARIERLETQLARSVVRAPFAGTVALRHLDPGTLVAPGTPIVRLISAGGTLARFAIPPEHAGRLTIGAPVRVEVETTGAVMRGVVEQLAPEIDAASQMVFVEAGLGKPEEAAGAVPSGSIARVALTASEAQTSCLRDS